MFGTVRCGCNELEVPLSISQRCAMSITTACWSFGVALINGQSRLRRHRGADNFADLKQGASSSWPIKVVDAINGVLGICSFVSGGLPRRQAPLPHAVLYPGHIEPHAAEYRPPKHKTRKLKYTKIILPELKKITCNIYKEKYILKTCNQSIKKQGSKLDLPSNQHPPLTLSEPLIGPIPQPVYRIPANLPRVNPFTPRDMLLLLVRPRDLESPPRN